MVVHNMEPVLAGRTQAAVRTLVAAVCTWVLVVVVVVRTVLVAAEVLAAEVAERRLELVSYTVEVRILAAVRTVGRTVVVAVVEKEEVVAERRLEPVSYTVVRTVGRTVVAEEREEEVVAKAEARRPDLVSSTAVVVRTLVAAALVVRTVPWRTPVRLSLTAPTNRTIYGVFKINNRLYIVIIIVKSR